MATRFGSVARDARVAARMSMKDVADVLNLSVAYISDIERGNRYAPQDKIDDWAMAIGVDPTRLKRYAMLDRRAVELPVDRSNADAMSNVAAFALERRWNALDERQYSAILRILQGDGDERLGTEMDDDDDV